jgi:hypothetical protein
MDLQPGGWRELEIEVPLPSGFTPDAGHGIAGAVGLVRWGGHDFYESSYSEISASARFPDVRSGGVAFGLVFHDLDGDGRRSAQEPLLPDFWLTVSKSCPTSITRVDSDAGGYFALPVAADLGEVTLCADAGWHFTGTAPSFQLSGAARIELGEVGVSQSSAAPMFRDGFE